MYKSKGNGNAPMSFPFAFISGCALKHEKAPTIHHCPKVRLHRDDLEVASDTRQLLSQERTGEQAAASQLRRESSLSEGTGGEGAAWQGRES